METTKIIAKEVLTTYHESNESFKIVRCSNGRVGAINTKYIENGKLNRELRGHDMFMSDNVGECIDRIHADFLKRDYMKQGFDEWASIILAHGGTIEEALKMSNAMQAML